MRVKKVFIEDNGSETKIERIDMNDKSPYYHWGGVRISGRQTNPLVEKNILLGRR